MTRQRGPKAHSLLSLFVPVVATVIPLLVASGAFSQSPGGVSQPSGKNFFLFPPQEANAPAQMSIPVTRPQNRLAVNAMDSLPPAFSTAVYSSGGTFAISVAVGDLNGDGWPDLVVANYCALTFMDCTSSSVAVLLGYGGGGFMSPTTYAAGGQYTYGVAIADVNGDGKLDVLVGNSSCYGYNYCVAVGELLGNGDGTLQPVTQYTGSWFTVLLNQAGSAMGTMAMADVNGDGKLDLVTVGGSSVSVQLGNGDGTFQPAVVYPSGGDQATGVAIADANGDGKPDIIVSNLCVGCQNGVVGVLLGNGDGTFQPAVTYASGGYQTTGVATADVNGDGYPDILTVSQCAAVATCSNSGATGAVGVLLGNGDGSFQPAISFGTGGVGSASITVADVNRDSKADLIVANQCNNQGTCPTGGGTVGVLINATPYTATTTTLVSSLNPSTVGQAVTFTATVKPNTGTLPDGEFITFKNGATVLGTAPLSAGTASLTTASLPKGPSVVTANYAFDGTYGASAAPLRQQVNAALRYATSVSLTVSPNPSGFEQTVTFTAQVKSSHGPIPDGEVVTFYSGTTVLGAAMTSSGVATFATSQSPANTHTAKAVYPGDATTFLPSSGAVVQIVNGIPTEMTLSSSLNPSTYGQKVTITATVWGPYITPTGNVKFTWDNYTIGTASLTAIDQFSSAATLTLSTLNADTYPVMAVYSGDAVYEATNGVMSQVVLQTASAATITSSENPSSLGHAVTFTATITSPTVTARGPVTFTAGKTVLGTAQLSGGKAKFTISTLAVGSTNVKATYYGDSNIAKSSASVTQTVQ